MLWSLEILNLKKCVGGPKKNKAKDVAATVYTLFLRRKPKDNFFCPLIRQLGGFFEDCGDDDDDLETMMMMMIVMMMMRLWIIGEIAVCRYANAGIHSGAGMHERQLAGETVCAAVAVYLPREHQDHHQP